MPQNSFKKIIICALIISFAAGSFFIPAEKTRAIDPVTTAIIADQIGEMTGIKGAISDKLGKIPGIGNIFKKIIGGSGKKVVPVFDVGMNPFMQTKEGVADSIIFLAAKFLIRQIVDDLADWLRGGAEGKPRFIQDFGEYLKEAGDVAGGLLLEQILKDDAKLLCEPWRLQIVLDVFRPRRDDFEFRAECKISDIIKAAKQAGVDIDFNDVYEDFNVGGWQGFLTMALDDGSNPIGSYLITLEEKDNRIAFETKKKELEATINKGLKISTCVNKFIGKSGKEFCIKSEIGTPGAAIEQILGKVFGSEISQLELADEINELIVAAIEGIRMKNLWRGRGIARSRYSEGDAGWLFDSSWCEKYGIDPKECEQWTPPVGEMDTDKINITISLDSYIAQERDFLIYNKNSKELIENEILPTLDRLAKEQPGIEIEIDDGQGGTAATTISGAKTYYENLLTQINANIQKAETLVYENDQTENPIYPLYSQDWGPAGQARNNFCKVALAIPNVRILARTGLEIFCTESEAELAELERYVEDYLPTIIDDSTAALNVYTTLQARSEELKNLLVSYRSRTKPWGWHDENDNVSCSANGWSFDQDDVNKKLEIRLLADNNDIGVYGTANLKREDVRDNEEVRTVGGCPDAYCGFKISLQGKVQSGKSYSITAQSKDINNNQWYNLPHGTPKTINCEKASLSAPDLIEPAGVIDKPAKFDWTDVEGAAKYRLEATYPDGSTAFVDYVASEVAQTQTDFDALSEGEYFWRVAGIDDKRRIGEWSEKWKVIVQKQKAVAPSKKFSAGNRIKTTDSVNVRQTPSTSGTPLGAQSAGALGTIIEGSTYVDNYHWWKIDYDTGPDGWSVENYLEKYTAAVTTDTIPPTVSITQPVSDQTISGTITIKATASDNVEVGGVQFKLDGANLGGEDATSPYEISWNTTAVSDGNHSLTATAKDTSGNQTTSSSVNITVQNISPSSKFQINDRIKTTDNVNVRESPSTSGTLLGAQSAGALGTIVEGSTYVDNYHWWKIDYDTGPDGWSVENYLTSAPQNAVTLANYFPLKTGNYWKFDDRASYTIETLGDAEYSKYPSNAFRAPFRGSDGGAEITHVFNDSRGIGDYGSWSVDAAGNVRDLIPRGNPNGQTDDEYTYYSPVKIGAPPVIDLTSPYIHNLTPLKICLHKDNSCPETHTLINKWEKINGSITTPAGNFSNVILWTESWGGQPGKEKGLGFDIKLWLAKDVGWIKHETIWYGRDGNNNPIENGRTSGVLTEYKLY